MNSRIEEAWNQVDRSEADRVADVMEEIENGDQLIPSEIEAVVAMAIETGSTDLLETLIESIGLEAVMEALQPSMVEKLCASAAMVAILMKKGLSRLKKGILTTQQWEALSGTEQWAYGWRPMLKIEHEKDSTWWVMSQDGQETMWLTQSTWLALQAVEQQAMEASLHEAAQASLLHEAGLHPVPSCPVITDGELLQAGVTPQDLQPFMGTANTPVMPQKGAPAEVKGNTAPQQNMNNTMAQERLKHSDRFEFLKREHDPRQLDEKGLNERDHALERGEKDKAETLTKEMVQHLRSHEKAFEAHKAQEKMKEKSSQQGVQR